jgi:hypothetical protein
MFAHSAARAKPDFQWWMMKQGNYGPEGGATTKVLSGTARPSCESATSKSACNRRPRFLIRQRRDLSSAKGFCGTSNPHNFPNSVMADIRVRAGTFPSSAIARKTASMAFLIPSIL